MKALYLYSGWVRAWHWLNALLFLTLMLTGGSMHFSGIGWLIPFETARPIHNVAGILTSLSWVWFVVANRMSGNGKHYRIRLPGLVGRLWEQSSYYAVGIFRNDPHPFHPSESEKLNELQKLTYIGVMYGLMPILVGSGLAFLLVPYLPPTLLGIGSVWVVAMAHLTVAYLLTLFLVTHLYVITTGDTVLANLKAMVTGWHGERET